MARACPKRRPPGRQVVSFVQKLRGEDLYKVPGIAETLDWAQALVALVAQELELPASKTRWAPC